jgi:hypothetical protein
MVESRSSEPKRCVGRTASGLREAVTRSGKILTGSARSHDRLRVFRNLLEHGPEIRERPDQAMFQPDSWLPSQLFSGRGDVRLAALRVIEEKGRKHDAALALGGPDDRFDGDGRHRPWWSQTISTS